MPVHELEVKKALIDKSLGKLPANYRSLAGSVMRTTGVYAAAFVLSLLVLVWVLKLWRADLSVPFVYAGDGLAGQAVVKGIIDNNWIFYNDFLGAPGQLQMFDFPSADSVHLLLIKALTLFDSNSAVVMNLFYFGTYPLTVVTSLFAFRRLKISSPVALVGSLLFAFLSYHIVKGEGHLFLAGIYIIPLSLLLILRICSGNPPFIKRDHSGAETFDFWNPRALGYGFIALLTGSGGLYYAFFACFLMVAAGVYASVTHKSVKRLIVAGIMTGIIAASLLANFLPSIIYLHSYGTNPAVAQRDWHEAELFSTSITQMIMPVTGHRIGYLESLKARFTEGGFNESDAASLGFVGSVGLLFLLGWLVFARGRDVKKDGYLHMLDTVSILNFFAVLLGIFGGLGLLFAFLVSPEIRAYNRVSVYIAFLSILGLLYLLEIVRHKYFKSAIRRYTFFGILAVILAVGLLDQTNPGMVPDYASLEKAYASDETYFRGIEKTLPPGAMVFQLPYVPFPENPQVNNMGDYEHLRAYVHTDTVHWSYGAMKGRATDNWQQLVTREATNQFLQDLARSGFCGVYLNRNGYADGGATIEKELENELNDKPVTNDNGTLLFFDMTDYNKRHGITASP